MQRRWRWLFASSLVCLAGTAWLAQSLGTSLVDWLNPDLLGMLACAVIGFAGAATRTRKRWPAVVALVCAGPVSLSSLDVLGFLPTIVADVGPSILLMMVGGLGAAAGAIYLIAAPPPAEPLEPIPPARLA